MNCRTIMQMCRRSGALAGVLSVLLCVPFLSCAQDRSHSGVQPASAPPPLLLGAAWYPEQWPESRWNADLDLMQKAHLHLVRLGEFSWSKLEPKEGKYDLDWMERAINLAGEHGIYVVIGTPSCAPPRSIRIPCLQPKTVTALPTAPAIVSTGIAINTGNLFARWTNAFRNDSAIILTSSLGRSITNISALRLTLSLARNSRNGFNRVMDRLTT